MENNNMRRINGIQMRGNNNMRNFESGVKTGIAGIFVANIIIIALVISGIVWGCNKVREKGLKGIAESVWNGNTNGNVPSNVSTN